MKSWGIFLCVLLLTGCIDSSLKQKEVVDFSVEGDVFTTLSESGTVLSSVKLETPPERVVVLSTPHLSFIKLLSVTNELVGVLEKERLDSSYHEITNVGTATQINLEKIIALNPDLILCNSGQLAELKRLKNSVPILVVDDYLAKTPLQKTKWILFFGEIFRKQTQAQSYYSNQEKTYETFDTQPIEIIQLNNFSGKYYLPGCESYIANLVRDAGGKFLCKSEKSSSDVLSEEEAILYMNKSDRLLFFDWASDTTGLQGRLSEVKGLANAKKLQVIYCNTHQSGFFEKSITNPSKVVGDLNALIKGETETQFFKLIKI